IIVNFKITAIKNGVETNSTSQTFSYVPTQWTKEGGPKDKVKYKGGDVIMYHWRKGWADDKETFVTH
ncbi:MAG: hypothetical protein RR835_02945, partial [Peptostreptococcaceae bacterium]